MKKLVMLLGIVMLQAPTWAAKDSKWRFGIGPELLFSSGYHDFLTDAFDGVEGGTGWVGIRAGLGYQINPRVIFQPQYRFYMNGLKQEGTSQGEQNYNLLHAPGVALKFLPYVSERWDWTISVEMNKPILSMHVPYADAKSNSLGYGVSTGLRLSKRVNFELGYLYLPVEASQLDWFHYVYTTEKYNFGGVTLGLYVEF